VPPDFPTYSPKFIPLTGADCFLRAFDGETRRYNGASHLSQLVLRLGTGFDSEAFRDALHSAARAQPILRAPIRRRFFFGEPAYYTGRATRAPLPRVRVHELSERPKSEDGVLQLPECAVAEINSPFAIRRGELLCADVLRYAGGAQGCDLVLTWIHMLFDGSGSEHFLRWLDACQRGATAWTELPEGDRSARPDLRGIPNSWSERGRMAREWRQAMQQLGEKPLRSLAGPLRRERQALRYETTTLSPELSARVAARANEKAGFLTPVLFYMAAALRAHDAVFRARGSDPGSYVVPLPVNLRPKGESSALFRTRVSILWFHVPAEAVRDFDGLVYLLRAQRRASIQQKLVEKGVAAMEFTRFAPRRFYARMARHSLRGELASCLFAYTGEFAPGLDHFFGAAIENGYHAPSVTPSPGSSAVMSFFRGSLNATHVYQRGVLSAEERALFRKQLLDDLTDLPHAGAQLHDAPR